MVDWGVRRGWPVALLLLGVLTVATGLALLLSPLHYGSAPGCGTALWSATAPAGADATWFSTCHGLRVTRQEYGGLVVLLGLITAAGGATRLGGTARRPGTR